MHYPCYSKFAGVYGIGERSGLFTGQSWRLIKSWPQQIVTDCLEMARGFQLCSLSHCFREANKAADYLSKLAYFLSQFWCTDFNFFTILCTRLPLKKMQNNPKVGFFFPFTNFFSKINEEINWIKQTLLLQSFNLSLKPKATFKKRKK